MTLAQDIAAALNRASRENESDTPDFILAEYLLGCLAAFETATRARERWRGDDVPETDLTPLIARYGPVGTATAPARAGDVVPVRLGTSANEDDEDDWCSDLDCPDSHRLSVSDCPPRLGPKTQEVLDTIPAARAARLEKQAERRPVKKSVTLVWIENQEGVTHIHAPLSDDTGNPMMCGHLVAPETEMRTEERGIRWLSELPDDICPVCRNKYTSEYIR